MQMPSPCLVVPRERGEEVRRLLLDQGLLNTHLRIHRDEKRLYLPILRRPPRRIPKTRCTRGLFESRRPGPPGDPPAASKYETVGDIALLRPDHSPEAAGAILRRHPNLKVVLRATGPIEGEWRTRGWEHLAGEQRLTTLYRENGCTFEVDLGKVYFSPRLATERARIARQVQPGETVLDLFAGGGYGTVQAARRASRVVAVDSNPDAILLLQRNLQRNRLTRVEVRLGDARHTARDITADRVLLDYPTGPLPFIPAAAHSLQTGGILHTYDILPEADIPAAPHRVAGAAPGTRWETLATRKVKAYAPRTYQVALDLRLVEKP